MNIPTNLQHLLDQVIMEVRSDPEHALPPFRRLVLYDAFGPTYMSTSYTERIQGLKGGQLLLTHADRIRARLAILTAQYVLPLWQSSLEEAQLLTSERIDEEIRFILGELIRLQVVAEIQPSFAPLLAQVPVDYHQLRSRIAALDTRQVDAAHQAVMVEYAELGIYTAIAALGQEVPVALDPFLAEHRSVYTLPIVMLPTHILQLAEGVLSGILNPGSAVSQSGDIRECFGNFLGYDEEEFPARAYDVGMACYEALNQALGLGPFDRQEVTSTTTDVWLMGEGAAAAPALKAYSGVFEENISTNEYDADKQQEFWLWWLTEAIPQVWTTEPNIADPPSLATMPFRATVRITAYRTGLEFLFDAPTDDDA